MIELGQRMRNKFLFGHPALDQEVAGLLKPSIPNPDYSSLELRVSASISNTFYKDELLQYSAGPSRIADTLTSTRYLWGTLSSVVLHEGILDLIRFQTPRPRRKWTTLDDWKPRYNRLTEALSQIYPRSKPLN